MVELNHSNNRNNNNNNAERNLVLFGLLCVFLVVANRASTSNYYTGDRYLTETLLVDLAPDQPTRRTAATVVTALEEFTTRHPTASSSSSSKETTTDISQEEAQEGDNDTEEEEEEQEEDSQQDTTASSSQDEEEEQETEESSPSQPQQPKILVAYAGPTSYFDRELLANPENITAKLVKSYEYHLNFEYFLKYGVNCNVQDTLLVVTEEVYPHYERRIRQMNRRCQKQYGAGRGDKAGRVLMMTRENKCLDLEAVRVATQESHRVGINITSYDYFFYINCGVSGPSRHLWEQEIPWTSLFLPRIRGDIKMTGLTLNCMGQKHIQSMMYGMDQEALQLILSKGTIFDCLERNPRFYEKDRMKQHAEIVINYERAMGRDLLHAGYGLDAGLVNNDTLQRPVFRYNESNCTAKGMWIGDRLRSRYNGRIPTLRETIFFKSTRYMSPELAEEIGYKAKIYKGLNW